MPRIRREGIPEALMAHLIRRVRKREISTSQLGLLARWLVTDPEVPEGRWFKRFPEMIVCGEGRVDQTFLRPGQVPAGEEVT
jgi:GNAT superfamily N-acetyltransferase